MDHSATIQTICNHAISLIKLTGETRLHFRPMRKQINHVNTKRGFVIGRTSLKTGFITIDIYTPKFRKPKKIAPILRTLAHEIAHHQKLPYRSRFRGRYITRIHYPVFYRQVNRNVALFKKDEVLGKYFEQ